MADLIDGDICEVRIFCAFGTQASINVRHLEIVDPPGGIISDQALVDLIDADVDSLYKPIISGAAEYRGVQLQKIYPFRRLPVAQNTNSGPGAVVGDPLPRQICGIISFRGQSATRVSYGRLYAPFPAESANEAVEGRPTAAYRTLLGDLASYFLAFHDLPGGVAGVNGYRYVLPSQPEGQLLEYVPMLKAVIRDRWATQRSRGDFGAANTSPV